jgi:energy-coupling factor transporter ATP-binding protein EcfA2
MNEAGWLLLLLFLGVCSLIVVALFWPAYRRAHQRQTAPVPPTPIIVDEAHQTAQRVMPLREWLALVNDRPDEAPHTLVVGTSGTGKTTIAQSIATTRGGTLSILDPKWQPGKWGGLPAVPIDDDGRYTQIEAAARTLLEELTARLVALKRGHTTFEEVTIIAEELPTLIKECPSASELFKQVGRMGRELRIRLVGLSQSERVKSLGIAGEGDAKDNYTLIRLGKLALDVEPEARSLGRPAVLEWKGEHHLITLEGLGYLANRQLPLSRTFRFVALDSAQFTQSPAQTPAQELEFTLEEIGVITAHIAAGTERTTAIRAMPRYSRKQHTLYAAYYDRLKKAMVVPRG